MVMTNNRGISMALHFEDIDPVATCECGWHAHGDAINDAVLAWTKHVTSTPACRDRLGGEPA